MKKHYDIMSIFMNSYCSLLVYNGSSDQKKIYNMYNNNIYVQYKQKIIRSISKSTVISILV